MHNDAAADDWTARVTTRAADPATVALVERFKVEADEYHPDEIYEAASQRTDLAEHPVLELAATSSAALAAEGPVGDLGAERAERLREAGRRLGEGGYRLGYSILADHAAPVAGLPSDELELIVEELDWPGICPALTLEVGDRLISDELAALAEDPEGAAADALFMAWDQGVAFAFAECLLRERTGSPGDRQA